MAVRDNGKAGKPDFVQSMSTADGLIRLYIFPSSPLFSFAFLFILVPFRCRLLVDATPNRSRLPRFASCARRQHRFSSQKVDSTRRQLLSRSPISPQSSIRRRFRSSFSQPDIIISSASFLLSINYRAVSPLSLSVFDKRLNCSRGFRVTNFDAGSVNLA